MTRKVTVTLSIVRLYLYGDSTDYNCTRIVLESIDWKEPVQQQNRSRLTGPTTSRPTLLTTSEQPPSLPYSVLRDIASCQHRRQEDIRWDTYEDIR